MVMIVADARVALCSIELAVCGPVGVCVTPRPSAGYSLFGIRDDRDVGPAELFTEVISESGGSLWDRVANDKTIVAAGSA